MCFYNWKFIVLALMLATVFAVMSVPACAADRSAAVLMSRLDGYDPILVKSLSEELSSAGYNVREIGLDGLCDSKALSKFDLLVIPDSRALPSRSMRSISEYLSLKKDIIALNAPVWQKGLLNLSGKWTTLRDYQLKYASVAPKSTFLSFAPGNMPELSRASNNMEDPTTYEPSSDSPIPGRQSLHVTFQNYTAWDTYGFIPESNPFANGDTLTVFSAKGDENTSQLVVEWQEKDGSRWMAVVPLETAWKRFVLDPDDFKYYQSTPGRGGSGDCFNPQNATKIRFGLAESHTNAVKYGRHEYWISSFGTDKMSPDYRQILDEVNHPVLEMLSPAYKFFDCHNVAKLSVRGDQAIIPAMDIPNAKVVRSVQPRPGGGGYDKDRDSRWIPLMEAKTADGEWRGVPAAMLIHTAGEYKGGIWVSFGVGDSSWYRSPSVVKLIGNVAKRMNDRVFMVDGGTDRYTYFEDQSIRAGARIANISGDFKSDLHAKVTVKDPVSKEGHEFTWLVDVKPGDITKVEGTFKPEKWTENGFNVTTELIADNKVIDRTTNTANVWVPKKEKHFITIKDGEFILDGKTWRAHGINYMPSSGIGRDDWYDFEYWLCKSAYDPEVIERDLEHVKDMGFNSISIFCYDNSADTQNLVDILRRSDKLGLKANVGLRPGLPFDFDWEKIKSIIELNRLVENDTVFAYDIAWEPSFGGHDYRAYWDDGWESWVIERYGSIESAEKDWGYPIPRDKDGKITNPSNDQIAEDGDWRVMVAAYRKYLDFLLYKMYGGARQLIRTVDSNHFVSFRMAEAANPTYKWAGRVTYDFPYLAAGVDFLAPEAYGRRGSWEKTKPGIFMATYSRWAAPDKPIIWAEAGQSSWDSLRMMNTTGSLNMVAGIYKDFYRMLIDSQANGVFYWWYPGGYRVSEDSDYGVIEPDGSDRAVTKVIREYGPKFLSITGHKNPDYWMEFDRDKYTNGIAGVYDILGTDYWKTMAEGKTPGLRTEATGLDSASCPLTAVGNTAWNGSNPLKYLDGAIDSVEVMDANGNWVSVEKGGSVEVSSDKPVIARIALTNLGEAKWLAEGKGRVLVTVNGAITSLPKSVEHLDSVEVTDVTLAQAGLTSQTDVILTLSADGKAQFGEKFTLILKPKG